MNLSEPLDGLTSAVEAAVLRVLSRSDTGFSGRQVHALAGTGSTSSVHRTLARFVGIGVVAAEARPPAIIYRANREHVLWPVIELALAARSQVFTSIRAFCEQELPETLGLTVIVYGSVARRDSTAESDIDLFVVYPDDIDAEARADFDYQIAAYTGAITGSEAQVYSIERAEVAQRIAEHDALVANVLAEGILICGPSLRPSDRDAA